MNPCCPPVVWSGEGRPPVSNHKCLHGLLYVLITGINWDKVLLDGSKKPAKKGAPTPGPAPSIAPSAARLST